MSETAYKPSAFYLRRRIRQAKTVEELRALGLDIVSEMERLKQWVRDQGMIPPKWTVDPAEAKEKGWKVARAAKAK
jgi:hypothetical protein